MNEEVSKSAPDGLIPRGDASGFTRYLRADLVSGLQVFLIALPLCLGISLASGFPPLAGIFTAIVGALVATFISNSEMTIKGPAAGMIVIVLGCVTAFGGDGMAGGWSPADQAAYQATLAVALVAGVLQILFGVFRAGVLGDFFPTSVVHGMLAAIGVIIMAKQIPVTLGVTPHAKEPLELLGEIPHFIHEANPAIAAIGLVSLAIMFVWPWVRKRWTWLRPVPAALVVLLVSVPMGLYFNLLHEHSFFLQGHEYPLGSQFLVRMPERTFGMFQEFAFPDFSALARLVAWKWVLLFFMIGTLESLLSAKAVDLLDPWKRKTNLDRDTVAVGCANLGAAMVGGLPMISEIVRSRANIDNGARTRFANFWHGLFLLLCVALIPQVLHLIPLAALAAMLVYTGFRLAHPAEFLHVYRIGREQLAIFVVTMVSVLLTDLLVGVAIGIALKMLIHVINGVPLNSLFKPYLEVEPVDEQTSRIIARGSAVFSNWIPFRRQIVQLGLIQKRNIIVDLSDVRLVDHSVMEKLEQLEGDFEREGLRFEIQGLDSLQPVSADSHAARRKGWAQARKLTVVAPEALETELMTQLIRLGATGYTAIPCRGMGRRQLESGGGPAPMVQLEIIALAAESDRMLHYLRSEVMPVHHVTAAMETVHVVRQEAFAPVAEPVRV